MTETINQFRRRTNKAVVSCRLRKIYSRENLNINNGAQHPALYRRNPTRLRSPNQDKQATINEYRHNKRIQAPYNPSQAPMDHETKKEANSLNRGPGSAFVKISAKLPAVGTLMGVTTPCSMAWLTKQSRISTCFSDMPESHQSTGPFVKKV